MNASYLAEMQGKGIYFFKILFSDIKKSYSNHIEKSNFHSPSIQNKTVDFPMLL